MKILKLINKKWRGILAVSMIGLASAAAAACIIYGVMGFYREQRAAATVTALGEIENGQLSAASALLKRSAADGDPQAVEFLAWLEIRRGNYEEALTYARQCSLHGSSACLEIMGDLALLGHGSATGVAAALSYFEQAAAAESDFDKARTMRAGMIERALPLASDPKEHLSLARAGLDAGSARAALEMGDILFLGDGLERSPADAVALWQRAREQGVREAQTRIAGALWHGYGIEVNQEEALKLYQSAADRGDPSACYSLALIKLREAQGPSSVLYAQALSLLDKAALQGYGPAASALGVLVLNEKFSELSQVSAAQWFYTAYTKMDASGSMLYALMLYQGLGLKADEEAALSILYDEAQNGSDVAEDLLKALSEGKDAGEIFAQAIEVCAQILLGKISFRERDYEEQFYHEDQVAYHHGVRNRYPENEGDLLRERIASVKGGQQRIVNPRTFRIDGNLLLLPSIGGVILQAEPSTGARMFKTLPEPPRPPAPPVPPGYQGDPLRLEYGF